MAGREEGAQQLQNQIQLNEVLKTRSKIYGDHEDHLSKQLKLTLGINEAAAGGAAGMESAKKRLEDITEAEKKAAKAAKDAAGAQKNFSAEIKNAADESEALQKKLEKASEVAGIFGDALSGATTSTFGMISAVGSLSGTIFNVGKAILAVPFSLWNSFVEASTQFGGGGGGPSALAQGMEEVRKSFGNLAEGSGKKVVDMYKNLSKSGKEAKQMGLSLSKVFGPGSEGQAAMLKFTAEMAGALGSQMNEVMDSIGKDMLKVTYGIKSLGLSNEEAGKAMLFFKNSGQDTSKMMQEMNAVAGQLATSTGFNIKTLGKAMVETTELFPQFAKRGVKAMAEVADYTHRLGISVKDLQSVFDKFDSFEGAAESASQLSQAFGVNIDAMKMVKEQSPTKKLEELRNAFKAAGKDINNMTSAERKLAEQTVGLTGAAFEAALGEGNKKKQLSESEKASEAATKAAKNQAAAMKELAKSIERVLGQGGGGGDSYKGFFEAFSKGFETGALKSENLKGIMKDFQKVLRQVYLFGKDLGKMFFDLFPGFDKVSQGLRKLFDPKVFKQFRIEAMKIFGDFFQDIQTDPKAGFLRLWDRLQQLFGNIFGDKAGGGLNLIKQGFEKITSVAGKLLGELTKKLLLMLTDGLKNLVDLIKNPNKLSGAADVGVGFASNFFGPILEALKELGPAVADAFMELLEVVFEKLKPYLEKVAIGLAMFWASKFAFQMAVGLGMMVVKEKIQKAIQGPGQDAMVEAIKENTKAMKEAQGAAAGAAQGPAASAQDSKDFFKKIAEIDSNDIKKAAKNIALMGVYLLGAIVVFAVAILALGLVMPLKEIAINSLLLIPVAAALAAFAGAVWILSKIRIDKKEMGKVALVITGLAVIAGLMTYFAIQGVKSLKDVNLEQVIAFGVIMGSIAGALVAMSIAVGIVAAIANVVPPKAMAIATVIIAALGYVMTELAIMATGALTVLAAVMDNDTAEKMILVSKAFAVFAEGMSSMGSALMKFSIAALNPFAFAATVVMMGKIMNTMSDKLPEIVEKMLKATEGLNPDEVVSKMRVMNETMKALEPIAGIAIALAKVAEEAADEDFNDEQINRVMNSLKEAFTTIVTQISGLVTGIISSMGNLSEAQVRSAQAVGPLLSGFSDLVKMLVEPMAKLQEGSQNWYNKNIDTDSLAENMKAFTEGMQGMVPVLGSLFDPTGPMKKLMDLVGGLTGFDEETAKKVKPFAETLKTTVDAAKFLIQSFGSVQPTKGADGKEVGKNIALITGMTDLMNTVSTYLFDPTSGFIPSIIGNLSRMTPISDETVKRLENVGKTLNSVLSPFMGLINVAADLGKFIVEASKEKVANSAEATVNTTKLTDMKDAMTGMMKGMIEALVPLSSSMTPLIEAILNAAKQINADPKTLTPKLDMILKAFEFLTKVGEIFGADGPLSDFTKSPAASGAAVEPSNLKKVIGNMNSVVDELFGKQNQSSADSPIYNILGAIAKMQIDDNFKILAGKGFANSVSNVFKALGEVFKAIGEIPAITKAPTIDETTIDNYTTIAGKLITVAEKGDYGKRIGSLATAISETVEAISTASGTLSEDKIKPVTDAVVAFSKFKGGDLSVKHNIPNVQMHIQVNLSAEQIAKSVVAVDINDPSSGKFPYRITTAPKAARK
jgi:hypothetical protein